MFFIIIIIYYKVDLHYCFIYDMFHGIKYLIVSMVFPTSVFGVGIFFLIAPFPDLCLLVPFYIIVLYVYLCPRRDINSCITLFACSLTRLHFIATRMAQLKKRLLAIQSGRRKLSQDGVSMDIHHFKWIGCVEFGSE